MQYYSVIKKNKIMSLVAIWMDLGMIILSHKENYDITNM